MPPHSILFCSWACFYKIKASIFRDVSSLIACVGVRLLSFTLVVECFTGVKRLLLLIDCKCCMTAPLILVNKYDMGAGRERQWLICVINSLVSANTGSQKSFVLIANSNACGFPPGLIIIEGTGSWKSFAVSFYFYHSGLENGVWTQHGDKKNFPKWHNKRLFLQEIGFVNATLVPFHKPVCFRLCCLQPATFYQGCEGTLIKGQWERVVLRWNVTTP